MSKKNLIAVFMILGLTIFGIGCSTTQNREINGIMLASPEDARAAYNFLGEALINPIDVNCHNQPAIHVELKDDEVSLSDGEQTFKAPRKNIGFVRYFGKKNQILDITLLNFGEGIKPVEFSIYFNAKNKVVGAKGSIKAPKAKALNCNIELLSKQIN